MADISSDETLAPFVMAICERIAKYAHGENWDDLPEEQKASKIDQAWRVIFKQEREFDDPYFVIHSGSEQKGDRFYSLDDARKAAREMLDYETCRYAAITEIIERKVGTLYVRATFTIEEE
jgi:hypothetical protein